MRYFQEFMIIIESWHIYKICNFKRISIVVFFVTLKFIFQVDQNFINFFWVLLILYYLHLIINSSLYLIEWRAILCYLRCCGLFLIFFLYFYFGKPIDAKFDIFQNFNMPKQASFPLFADVAYVITCYLVKQCAFSCICLPKNSNINLIFEVLPYAWWIIRVGLFLLVLILIFLSEVVRILSNRKIEHEITLYKFLLQKAVWIFFMHNLSKFVRD